MQNQKATMNKNAVIFDFDGTLADSFDTSHRVMNVLAKKYRFKSIDSDDLKRLKELPLTKILSDLGIAPYKIPLVMAAGKKLLKDQVDSIPLHQGVSALLAQLSQHYSLGIVTTNGAQVIKAFQQRHNLVPMDFIYSDIRLSGKGRTLKQALKKQKIKRALYVGDEIRDIQAARKAGIAVVAVCWGYNSKQALAAYEPDYLVESCAELERVIGAYFG
ncbi:MAG: phosphoglycolate phosphatase [Phenylobacterium sp.]|jgi:phosphoglycolate phosphatase